MENDGVTQMPGQEAGNLLYGPGVEWRVLRLGVHADEDLEFERLVEDRKAVLRRSAPQKQEVEDPTDRPAPVFVPWIRCLRHPEANVW